MYVRIRSLPFFVSLLLLAVSSSPVHAQQTTANEDFEFGLPAGWTVIDNTGSGAVWHFDELGSGNDTGGDGRFAQAESGGVYDDVDTELRTPVMDLSCATRVFLDFKTDANLSLNDVADVDVSVGGGAGPWTNVWRKTASYAGPRTELVDLTSLAAGEDQVMIRFRYYNGFNDGTWQIDDVVVHTNVELLERFPGTLAPASWTVIDNTGSGAVWHFDELSSGNDTGGDGRFAQAESGDVYDDVDTELRTPVIDLSDATKLRLEFRTDVDLGFNDVADVDVSTAGATGPWTNVWRRRNPYHGPRMEVVDLTSPAAGEADVVLRFRYYDGFNDGTWQVDDVVVSAICVPEPGQLIQLAAAGLALLFAFWHSAVRRSASCPARDFTSSGGMPPNKQLIESERARSREGPLFCVPRRSVKRDSRRGATMPRPRLD